MKRMRLAIVGAGISGNLVARLLHESHDVHLIESQSHLGGHSQTVDVPTTNGHASVDVGFMVFNQRTYPGFCELLERLGVDSRESDMSFSVHCEQSGREYQGSSLNGLFAQRSNLVRPSFLRLIRDVLRFNRRSVEWLEQGRIGDEMSVGELLTQLRMGNEFRRLYLVPMAAAIWSAVPNRILDFPARFLVGFFRNHGLLQVRDRPQWRTICDGSRSYVSALLHPLGDRVQLNSPVRRVERTADHVLLQFDDDRSEVFDQVIFACHADQALSMLSDPTADETSILGALPYQSNRAVLHEDDRVLPRRRRAWASWNYHVPADFNAPASVTYDLGRLQGVDSSRPILLTLNGERPIKPECVIREFSFAHPVFNRRSLSAQRRHHEISGVNRTHFCGAYWGYGFHEDGVQSALTVAKHFGKSLADLPTSSRHAADSIAHQRRVS